MPTTPEPPALTQADPGTQSALPFPVGTLYTVSWASSESGFSGCSSGTAYYSIVQSNVFIDAAERQWEDWLIVCTDYETRVQAPLCSVPGCTHTDDSCPAFLRSRSSMENFYIGIVNGQLYVLHDYWNELAQRSDADNKPTVWLETAALDGSGRTRLTELPPEWQLTDAFLLTDGTAFYGQYGDQTDMGNHGIRVELESGDYTTFSFGLDDEESLIGSLGSQFLLSRWNNMFPPLAYPDVIAAQERYNLSSFSYSFFSSRKMILLDPAAGTRRSLNETLLAFMDDDNAYNALYNSFFQQGKYYCTVGNFSTQPQTLWQIDFATGESRVLAQNDPDNGGGWWNMQGLTLFPTGSGIEEPYVNGYYWTNSIQHGFLLNVHDGTIRPIALRYKNAYSGTSPVVPLAQTNDGLWLVQTQEVPVTLGRYRFFYALAEPETVFSGEGELYPIEMWIPEAPLG